MRSTLVMALVLVTPAVALSQDIDIVYDSTDAIVGKHADTQSNGVIVHTYSGYRVRFETSGRVAQNISDIAGSEVNPQIYFLTADCSGPRYVTYASEATTIGGVVFESHGPGYDLYYIPKNAPSVSGVILKELSTNGSCSDTAQAGPSQALAMALPNAPSITGVPDQPYVPPLRLEMAPIAVLFDLFRDGFEAGVRLLLADYASTVAQVETSPRTLAEEEQPIGTFGRAAVSAYFPEPDAQGAKLQNATTRSG